MNNDQDWISVTDKLPDVDDICFSDDVYIKVGKVKAIGYYDSYQMQWWRIFKINPSIPVQPTHWMKIPHE